MTTKTVLGTIIGTKTLSGEWAGKSKLDDSAPAVAAKPMASAGQPVRPTKPEPKEPASPPTKTASKPKDDEPPAKTEPQPDEAEKRAGQLFRLAKSYLGAGMKPQALKKLNEIVSKYPKTEVARKAKLLLADF